MYYQLSSYLKFFLRAKRKHGVHSPFVFDFANACFYQRPDKSVQNELKKYRQLLCKNHQKIKVHDFGAGSKAMASQEREIAQIAKNAGISFHRACVLHRIVDRINAKHVLEIGTSLGIGTASMAIAHPQLCITTLEGCTQTAAIAQQQFNQFGLTAIQLRIGPFEETLTPALQDVRYDLVFFDGNHQKEATLQYFEQCLAHKHEQSVFIFDDIYWSRGMTAAWEIIKKHPEVSVTIDTFYWGMVFFRKGQVKENFTIRMR